jgi:hypothetical protein
MRLIGRKAYFASKTEVHSYFIPHTFMVKNKKSSASQNTGSLGSFDSAVSQVVQDWIELSRKYKGKPGEARVLDIVKHNGKYYFVDDRLKELRNVEDFMDTIKFKTPGELFSFRLNECFRVT